MLPPRILILTRSPPPQELGDELLDDTDLPSVCCHHL